MRFFIKRKIVLSLIFVFWISCFIVLPAFALDFTPNVTIPGKDSKFIAGEKITVEGNLLGAYIVQVYKFAVGIAAILAVLMIAFGGVLWVFSGGVSEKVGKAKEMIVGAVIGLVLALGSYLILFNINPELVSLKLTVPGVGKLAVSKWCTDWELPEGHENDKFKCVGDDCRDYKNAEHFQKHTLCGLTYEIPNSNGQTCKGGVCNTSGEMCVYSDFSQLVKTNGKMTCMEAKKVCERITDDETGKIGLSDDQSACDAAEIPEEFGYCRWSDQFDLIDDDKCYFLDKSSFDKCWRAVINKCEDYNRLFDFDVIGSHDHTLSQFACEMDICANYLNRAHLNCYFNFDESFIPCHSR